MKTYLEIVVVVSVKLLHQAPNVSEHQAANTFLEYDERGAVKFFLKSKIMIELFKIKICVATTE